MRQKIIKIMHSTKISFEELSNTLISVTTKIDAQFAKAKNGEKGERVSKGYDNFKTFLEDIETKAIKETAEETGLTVSVVRERWRVMTLPDPIYSALEKGEIMFSKAKILASTNLDFNDPKDIEIAQKVVDAIKNNVSTDDLKELIKTETKAIWHAKTIVMERLAEQNHISAKTIC